jgi:flagellar motility protein MotE (MotC chaperone)
MSQRASRPAGALATLALGFLASALLRAGDVVAALPALPGDGFGNPIAGAPAQPAEPGDPTERAMRILADLESRRARLGEREAALEERRQTLEAIETRVEDRLQQLERARRRLEETAVIVDDAAERDVRHLADMYRRMKPKEAARIFDRMPPSFAAGFLGAMEAEEAALIMASMEADRAYAVSLLLAGRNLERGRGGGARPADR